MEWEGRREGRKGGYWDDVNVGGTRPLLLGSPWSGQGDQRTVPGKELSRELATSNC